MRWRSGKTQDPELGEIRTRYKFAWFPTECQEESSGTPLTLWLERYEVTEQFSASRDGWYGWEPLTTKTIDNSDYEL